MGEEPDEAGEILGMQETQGGSTACRYGAEQASVGVVRGRPLALDRCTAAGPDICGRPWGGRCSGSGVTRVFCAAGHDLSFHGVRVGVLFGARVARSMDQCSFPRPRAIPW